MQLELAMEIVFALKWPGEWRTLSAVKESLP
jgi:hypothetical protein